MIASDSQMLTRQDLYSESLSHTSLKNGFMIYMLPLNINMCKLCFGTTSDMSTV